MIVPMMKYSLIMHHSDYEGFLGRLQELGLVDITVSGWSPTLEQVRMLQTIERYSAVNQELNALAKNNDLSSIAPMSDGREVFEKYNSAFSKLFSSDFILPGRYYFLKFTNCPEFIICVYLR